LEPEPLSFLAFGVLIFTAASYESVFQQVLEDPGGRGRVRVPRHCARRIVHGAVAPHFLNHERSGIANCNVGSGGRNDDRSGDRSADGQCGAVGGNALKGGFDSGSPRSDTGCEANIAGVIDGRDSGRRGRPSNRGGDVGHPRDAIRILEGSRGRVLLGAACSDRKSNRSDSDREKLIDVEGGRAGCNTRAVAVMEVVPAATPVASIVATVGVRGSPSNTEAGSCAAVAIITGGGEMLGSASSDCGSGGANEDVL
jgi:hypothetical protein